MTLQHIIYIKFLINTIIDRHFCLKFTIQKNVYEKKPPL